MSEEGKGEGWSIYCPLLLKSQELLLSDIQLCEMLMLLLWLKGLSSMILKNSPALDANCAESFEIIVVVRLRRFSIGFRSGILMFKTSLLLPLAFFYSPSGILPAIWG